MGTFKDFPSKVKLLPGLVPVVNKFIDAAKSLKRKSNQESSVVPKRKKKCPEKKQNFQEPDCDPVLNLLRSNMVAWFDRQQNATVIAQQIGYKLPVDNFPVFNVDISSKVVSLACYYLLRLQNKYYTYQR